MTKKIILAWRSAQRHGSLQLRPYAEDVDRDGPGTDGDCRHNESGSQPTWTLRPPTRRTEDPPASATTSSASFGAAKASSSATRRWSQSPAAMSSAAIISPASVSLSDFALSNFNGVGNLLINTGGQVSLQTGMNLIINVGE